MSVNWKNVDRQTQLRVVFYGRVSTEHEAQLSALQNQIQWYYDQLDMNPSWELAVPIEKYLDKGITGTQAKKRPGFLQMISDAHAGEFDMIVTREVCRFARNTVDTLKYVRELKDIGVQVYFVCDNIKTIEDNSGEFKLTIMAMMAQEESRKISERSKAGQYISRNNGVLYGSGNILGYTRIRKRSDSDKRNAIGDKSVPTFAIMPEEAETVRLIFKWYVDGLGLKRIKNQLLIEQRKNSSGQVKWFESVISNILSNPMYIGKQYQCQTEVTDFLEHTVKKNKPEDFVLVEGDFEPIISEELFDRVQEIKRQRYIQNHIGEQHYGYKISLDKWRSKLECSCGSKFQQYIWRTNARGDTAIGYTCRHRVMDGSAFHRIQQGLRINDACSMPSIPAWKFDFMALRIFSDIWKLNKDCIKAVQLYLIQYCTENRDTSQVMDVEGVQKQIKHFEGQIKEITKSYIAGRVTAPKYEEKSKEYISKLEYLRTHLDEMQSSTNRKIHTPKDGQSLCRMFSALMDCSGEWIDKYIVENFVDKIVVQNTTEFDWYVNLYGDSVDFLNRNNARYCNEPYGMRAQKTIELQQQSYNLAFTLHIPFDEVKAYKKRSLNFKACKSQKLTTTANSLPLKALKYRPNSVRERCQYFSAFRGLLVTKQL